MSLLTLAKILSGLGFAVSFAYVAFAVVCVVRHRRETHRESAYQPPVTIAKPICGLEAGLEENLRSYFNQDYPRYEIVFGVRDPQDPALASIRKAMEECPGTDATLLINGDVPGTNRKVANLVTICRSAKHGIIVVADSDIRVDRDYLKEMVAPYEDETVGAVTCLTVADPVSGLPSTLGAMYINEEFLPSILVAMAVEPLTYCFGPTMSARKSALDAIGGFEALTNHLADDHRLGNLIAQKGLKVELASCVVKNVLHEPSIRSLFLHELRWARTIRTVRPLGYTATVVTMITPWALAVLLAFRFSPVGWLAVAVALGMRAIMQLTVRSRFGLTGAPAVWWIPVRELLSFSIYCASHLGQRVLWKRNLFRISSDGRLHEEGVRA